MRPCLLPASFLLAAVVDAQQWTSLDGPQYLDRAAAFDTHRQRLVMFSGDGETWEYDGDQMLHRPRLIGAPVPPGRSRAQMAYDPLRRHVLLFGGLAVGPGGTLADTWTFDGARWTQRVSAATPGRRVDAGITWDSARGRVLMFGGQSLLPGQYSDTWEHDGTQWLQRSPATVPGPNSPVMAFDSGRGVAVMVVNSGMLGQPVSTWEWNGTNWLLRTPAGAAPTVGGNESLAYDPVRQRTVMTGGTYTGEQVWEWDGTAWTQMATVLEPIRINAASWFDPVVGKVVVAGGNDVRIVSNQVWQGSVRSDAFVWDGVAMTPRRPDLRPPSRYGHAWFADPVRQQLMLFGGVRSQALVADTWRWNGTAWTPLSPANQPSARADAATTFDWLRGEALLFGGTVSGQFLGDLWAWTGTDWAPRGSGIVPPARANAGFCFDLLRGVAVLFGGSSGPLFTPGSLRNDTWEWNGATWANRPTAVQPSPREGSALAFDVARSRVVLFGGRTGATANDQLADTWEWDGTQWTAVQPTVLPPALLQPSLAFDFVRSRSVLSGTRIFGQPAQFSFELWGFNGVTWTSIAAVPASPPGGFCAYDVARDRLVAASGGGLSEWSTQSSSVTEYGAGCGAPVPALLARGRPRIGEVGSAFGFDLMVAPGQLVGFALAEAQASVPLGNGCTMLFGQPAASVFGLAGGNGIATLPMAIPDLAVLHGYVIFAQGGVLDAASPGGFRLTQGLRFAFGD